MNTQETVHYFLFQKIVIDESTTKEALAREKGEPHNADCIKFLEELRLSGRTQDSKQ